MEPTASEPGRLSAVTLGASRVVTVAASNLTVGGAISDGGAALTLTKTGSQSTLVLNGNNTYTGPTSVTAGTLAGAGTILSDVSIGAGAALAAGDPAAAPNTLTLASAANPLTVGASGQLNFRLNGPPTVSNTGAAGLDDFISAPNGPVNLSASGVVVIASTTIGAGGFQVGTYRLLVAQSITGTVPQTVAMPPGFAGSLAINGTALDLTVKVGKTWTGAAAPDTNWMTAGNWQGGTAPLGDGTDTLSFPATANLATNNNFPAGTSFVAIGVTGGGYTFTGNALNVSGLFSIATPSGNTQINLVIGGNTGGLSCSAAGGTVTLAANNTYSGNTTVSAGTLNVGGGTSAGSLGAGPATVTANGTLAFNRSDTPVTVPNDMNGSGFVQQTNSGTLTLAGNLSGGINVQQNGAGILILSGAASTYSGTTAIAANGTVRITTPAALGTSTTTVASGATLDFSTTGSVNGATLILNGTGVGGNGALLANSTGAWNGPVTIASASTINVASGVTWSDTAVSNFAATNALTKAGAGIMAFATPGGVSTGTGTLAVNAGIFRIDGSSRWNSGSIAVNANGTLQNTGAGADSIGDSVAVTVNSGGVFDMQQTGTETIASLTLNGTGIGGTGAWINSGTAAAGNLTATGGILLQTDTTVGGSGNLSTGSIISGGFSLTKIGTNTLTLTGLNTYSGAAGTTVNAGTLSLGAGTGGTGTIRGTLTINSGATVVTTAVDALGFTSGACVTTVNINGGTLNSTSGGNEGFLANFNLTGGTVSGNGAFNFSTGFGINSLASSTTSLFSANISIRGAGLTITTATGTAPGGIDLNVSGVISIGNGGSLGVTKAGPGTLSLSGANTYTGPTNINAGILNLGKAEIAGTSGPLGTSVAANPGSIVFGGGTLQYSLIDTNDYSGRLSAAAGQPYSIDTNAQNVVFATALSSSAGTLTKLGAGTLTLTAGNNYNGTTTISAGTLQIGNGGITGTPGLGGIVDNAILAFNRSDTGLVVSNAISGSGSVQQIGSGTTFVSGTNSYIGGTSLSAGTLSLGSTTALGATASTLTISGGTLDSSVANLVLANNNPQSWNADFAFAGSNSLNLGAGVVTLGGNRSVNVKNNNLTIGGAISDGGNLYTLTQTGFGALVLNGINTYAGATTINAGTIAGAGTIVSDVTVNANGTLAAGDPGAAPGTLTLTSAANPALINSTGQLSFRLNGPPTLSNTGAAGVDDFLVAPNGPLTLAASNVVVIGSSNIGPSGFQTGTYRLLTVKTILGTAPANVIMPPGFNGTLAITNGNTSLDVTVTSGKIWTGAAAPDTNWMTGGNWQGGVAPTGSGTETLSFPPTANLATNNNFPAGTSFVAIGVTGSGYTFTGNTLNESATFSIATPSGNTTVNILIGGAGGFSSSAAGGGTVILTANNTYGGTTTVSSGTLNLGNGTAAGMFGVGPVTNNGTLVFNRTDNPVVANNIGGLGSVQQIGTGTLAFSGVSSYSGTTTLAAGILNANSSPALGDGSVTNALIFTGGTLQAGGTIASPATRSVTLNSNALIDTNANAIGIAGVISGGGGLITSGSGTLTLSGANTYFGTTAVQNGTLVLGTLAGTTVGSIPPTSAVTLGSGTTSAVFQLGDTNNPVNQTLGSLTIAGTGTANAVTGGNAALSTLTLNLSANAAYSGSFGGSGSNSNHLALVKTGAGSLTLSGASTLAGPTTVGAGTLALSGGNNRLGTASPVIFAASATLDLGSTSQQLPNLSLAPSTLITATITGAAGALILDGTNDFMIGATVTGSTVNLDMHQLGSFTYNSTTKAIHFGPIADFVGNFVTVNLAQTNTLTTASFGICDVGPNANTLNVGTVNLGQTNAINANAIVIGNNKSTVTLDFAAGLIAPTLQVRGTAGGSTRAALKFGQNNSGQQPTTATMDLTGGSLDALFSTMVMGENVGGTQTTTVNFKMGTGTLDATSISLAKCDAATGVSTGTFSVNGGTVVAGTLTLADQAAGAALPSATFNLTSGTLKAQTVQPGANSGTRIFNWVTGTIQNYDANTDFTIAASLTLTLAAGNPHTFSLDTSRTGTVNAVLTETGSSAPLSKIGPGTLVLSGTNTYTGATQITGGTLQLGGTGSLNGSSAITVSGSGAKFLQTSTTAATPAATVTQGTLDGTGVVGATTVGAGTGGIVANGNGGSGALTLNALTFSGAGTANIDLAGGSSTAAGLIVTNALTTSGTGSVTVNVTFASNFVGGATYNLIGYGSFAGNLTDFVQGTISGVIQGRQMATLGNDTVNKFITLTITTVDSPKWTGLDQVGGSAEWMTGTTGPNSNWKLINAGTATNFFTGDIVLFDDMGAIAPAVHIGAANVSPSSTTFSNSSVNYSLNGPFGIATGTLTKNGTGSLTINTVNTYSGTSTINGGVVSVQGAIASPTSIKPGGILRGTGTVGAVTAAGGALFPGTALFTDPNPALTTNQVLTVSGSNGVDLSN